MPVFLPYGISVALSLGVSSLGRAQLPIADSPIAQSATEYISGMEVESFSRSKLPKWRDLAERHDRQVSAGSASWKELVRQSQHVKTTELLRRVNQQVNRIPYVKDSSNWGTPDYWATPQELLERGGDCEDYAIAKYLILRKIGVSPADMRIAVSKSHAVLIVTTQQGPVVLDSARPEIRLLDARFARTIVFVVNEQSWAVNLGREGYQLASR